MLDCTLEYHLFVFKNTNNPGQLLFDSRCTFKCPRCNTCAYVHSTDTIVGPKGQFFINKDFTCTTANVISCIISNVTCILGKLNTDRFTEHLRFNCLKQHGLPVTQHFYNNHNIKTHVIDDSIIYTVYNIFNSFFAFITL